MSEYKGKRVRANGNLLMDLEEKLIQANPDLFSYLEDIKKSCGEVWKDRLLPWFTNHNCEHSIEVIQLLGQILKPLENHHTFLNKHELFILLASAYLHDFGMQFLKIDDISIDRLTETEYNEIRRRHAEESYNIILKMVQPSIPRDDFHLPKIDEEYLPVIARVVKGHSTDYFDSVISDFQADPLTPKGKEVRGELLTALLMIADELDLQAKRVDFGESAKFKLSTYSLIHWFKHHYVDYVGVKNTIVTIILRYPEGAITYPALIRDHIKTKLVSQIERVNPIFRNMTGGLLHLETTIDFVDKTDKMGIKRPLPDEVLNELQLGQQSVTVRPVANPVTGYCNILPKPSIIFTGREDDIDKFKKALETAVFISIEGLGGIGKTEFASKCIDKYILNDRVVWFDCVRYSKLDMLIACAGYPDVLKGESKTELAKYSGFTDLIERDRKIIFLDNFQEVLDPSFKAFFKFAERRLSKARVILLSREAPDAGVRVVPVPLEGLHKDSLQYARRLIGTYYNSVIVSDDKLQGICDNLHGHPFAIEFAIKLLRYGETPDNIIEKIAREKGRNEELSNKLLDEVFSHPNSSDEEREVLVLFSVFRNAIDKRAIMALLNGRDITDILRKLDDKKMITRAQDTGIYNTHPLIREFCYQKLEDKSTAHLRAAEYLQSQATGNINPSSVEEIYHHYYSGGHFERAADLVTTNGESFILSGYTNSLSDMLSKLDQQGINQVEFEIFRGDIATIRGEWQEALQHFEKTVMLPEVSGRLLAEAYIKYGEIFFRMGSVHDAHKYFEDAYKNSKGRYKREEARSLNDLGLVQEFMGNLTDAEQKLRSALNIRLEIGDKDGIAATLNNIGNVLHVKGQLNESLQKYNESLKYYEEAGSREGIAIALSNLGGVLQTKGQFDKALDTYSESLKIYEEIGAKYGIANILNCIGSVLRDKGQVDTALNKYAESLKISKDIGSQKQVADSLNNEGSALLDKGNFDKALNKYVESLKISKDIGDRRGVATALNNIGNVAHSKGQLDDALRNLTESLTISEEVGDLIGIANRHHNIGTLHFDKKDYRLALHHLLLSLSLQRQIGMKKYATNETIENIRQTLPPKIFNALIYSTLEALPAIFKEFIQADEFRAVEQFQRINKKIGRNDPCTCGSGKKSKKCCGT